MQLTRRFFVRQPNLLLETPWPWTSAAATKFMSCLKLSLSKISSIWVFPKIWGKAPNHPMFNRVFHYFHHPFWGVNTPIFGKLLNLYQIHLNSSLLNNQPQRFHVLRPRLYLCTNKSQYSPSLGVTASWLRF